MTETSEQIIEKVKTLLETGEKTSDELLEGIQNCIPIKQEQVDSNPNATEFSSAFSKLKLGQMTKLRKYERGENFSRFCERFAEFVQITKIADENLHLFFLQNVDDETYATLKSVNLKESEQRDCTLFCEIYKTAIYGAESIPLKNEVQECKQLIGESMTTFSHRLKEKAEIAFSSQQSKDENCLLALLRGVRDKEIRRKLNESSVTTFSEALKLALKLEKINSMFEVEYNPTSILQGSRVSFSERNHENREPRVDTDNFKTASNSRSRQGSYDSRNTAVTSSPARYRNYNRVGNSRDRSLSGGRNRSQVRPASRNPSSVPIFRGQSSREMRCWNCNRAGHFKRNCYARNRRTDLRETRPRQNLN